MGNYNWLDYEQLEEEAYDDKVKSIKTRKPKKSWKEASNKRESKRNKGFNKKRSNR